MDDRSRADKLRLQYLFDCSDYRVAAGGDVTVSVFLRETFNPTVASSLLAPATDGLVSCSVVIQACPPTPTHPARVRTTSAIAGNHRFDFAIIPQLPVPSLANSVGLVALSSAPVFGEVGSRTANCVTVLLPLGTFTFTAGAIPGEVTHLTAMNTEINLRMPGECVVTASGLPLDKFLQPGQATITVGPELAEAKSTVVETAQTSLPGHAGRIRRRGER
jgi:hypothetical protein